MNESGDVTPESATSAIDKLEDADRTMRSAGLMQLPYIIQALKSQQDALKQSNLEIDRLQKQLDTLSKPTLFLEGHHDVKAYPKLLSALGVNGDFEVKQFSGTPKNTKEFVSAISAAGGLSPKSKTLFLFDNDQAGRSALAAFCGKGSGTSGLAVNIDGKNLSAAVLPYQTQKFVDFMNECDLKESEIKFPFELLFVNDKTLEFIKEKTADDSDWLDGIHDDYYHKPQKLTNRLRKFPPGSPGWLYARMVPDRLKSKYITIALKSANKECDALKTLANTVRTTLQLPQDA